ncbi:MAG: SPFH domain-containing protein, partial [Oscillospiraceae bacterium]
MEEKVLKNKKNGLLILVVLILLYLAATCLIIAGGISDSAILLAVGVIWTCIGWIPFMGLKVIKPQEAIVLTLFGEYVGTLKT